MYMCVQHMHTREHRYARIHVCSEPHVRYLLPAEVFVNKQPSTWERAALFRTHVDLDPCGVVQGQGRSWPWGTAPGLCWSTARCAAAAPVSRSSSSGAGVSCPLPSRGAAGAWAGRSTARLGFHACYGRCAGLHLPVQYDCLCTWTRKCTVTWGCCWSLVPRLLCWLPVTLQPLHTGIWAFPLSHQKSLVW